MLHIFQLWSNIPIQSYIATSSGGKLPHLPQGFGYPTLRKKKAVSNNVGIILFSILHGVWPQNVYGLVIALRGIHWTKRGTQDDVFEYIGLALGILWLIDFLEHSMPRRWNPMKVLKWYGPIRFGVRCCTVDLGLCVKRGQGFGAKQTFVEKILTYFRVGSLQGQHIMLLRVEI